jgi:PPOX class probable F420-dependent enzyme
VARWTEEANMRTMSDAEYRAFMTQGTRTAKAATVSANGLPHVKPIWFVLDGDDLIFTTHKSYVMTRHLRRRPHIALTIDDQEPPYSFAIIEGTVTLSEDLGDLARWATLIGGRYMGADRAEEFGKRNGVPGELLVRVTPIKALARADIAGY